MCLSYFFVCRMRKRKRSPTFNPPPKPNGVTVYKVGDKCRKDYCTNCCEKVFKVVTNEKRVREDFFTASFHPHLEDIALLPTRISPGRCRQCDYPLAATFESEFQNLNDVHTYMTNHNSDITTEERMQIASEAFRVVQEFHRRNYAHGDVKPENMIV